jgi:hypothetical protein
MVVCLLLCTTGSLAGAQSTGCDGALPAVRFAAPMTPGGAYLTITAGCGGLPHSVQVDTGSTGIAIRRDTIGQNTPAQNPPKNNYLYYNSSGNLMCGSWVQTDVTLSDSKGTRVTVPSLPVLAVDFTCQVPPPLPDNPCQTCTPGALTGTGPAMLGVGFDRGADMGGPQQNAFLQLQQMNAGTMQRGYIITSEWIQLGITPHDLDGFQFVKLSPNGPDSSGYDWQQAPGCVSITGGGVTAPGQNVCGKVLMDTGVDRMYLSYVPASAPQFQPPLPPSGNIWECCGTGKELRPCIPREPLCRVNGGQGASVTVTWPATPQFSYTARAPQQFRANGTNPIFAHVNPAATPPDGAPVFVNTSRQMLFTADYLYDAQCGRVGFRRKPQPPPASRASE